MPLFGVNVNNREPFLTEHYSIEDMFANGKLAESLGFDSVWVGDNLIERPRLEPMTCLAHIAAQTESVELGTACMITGLRNPIQLAQVWTTLDLISDGRAKLGACLDKSTDLGDKQYEISGVPPEKFVTVFEEGLAVANSLWEKGDVTFSGEYFEFEDVEFRTGNEVVPFLPKRDKLPVQIVSNPGPNRRMPQGAVERIVELADGWMTGGVARDPEAYTEHLNQLREYAEEYGRDPDSIDTSYQVTLNMADTEEEAYNNIKEYITSYYPQAIGSYKGRDRFRDRGPLGDAQIVIDWIQEFHDRGLEEFVLRFAAEDQEGQIRRFAEEVLPSF